MRLTTDELPLLVYHGRTSWNVPTRLIDCIDADEDLLALQRDGPPGPAGRMCASCVYTPTNLVYCREHMAMSVDGAPPTERAPLMDTRPR